MIEVFLFLLFCHFLADYPLQGDYLAKFKNESLSDGHVPWWYIMGVHSAIHAGFVLLITGSVILFFLEFLAHFLIDTLKCKGKFGYLFDQFLHILCKIIWVGLLTFLLKV